jgi:hypothetical protein
MDVPGASIPFYLKALAMQDQGFSFQKPFEGPNPNK